MAFGIAVAAFGVAAGVGWWTFRRSGSRGLAFARAALVLVFAYMGYSGALAYASASRQGFFSGSPGTRLATLAVEGVGIGLVLMIAWLVGGAILRTAEAAMIDRRFIHGPLWALYPACATVPFVAGIVSHLPKA